MYGKHKAIFPHAKKLINNFIFLLNILAFMALPKFSVI
jgi:hypothetical protein